MRSVTNWYRLEPQTRNPDLTDGVRAPVHDPLWLLGRQWQFGEFAGEDAGSPVSVAVRGRNAPLSRFRAGAPAAAIDSSGDPTDTDEPRGADSDPYDPSTTPLEPLVEREPVRPNQAPASGGVTDGAEAEAPRRNYRDAAAAGTHFQRLLSDAGFTGHAAATYPDSVRIDATAGPEDGPAADRFLGVVDGRALDGDVLARDVAAARDADGRYTFSTLPLPDGLLGEVTPEDGSADAERAALTDVLDAYLDWYRSLYQEPGAAPGTNDPDADANSAWNPERMEYRFAVAAEGQNGEITLSAPEYHGGRLDWYDFDVASGESLGTQADGESSDVDETLLPTPVSFHGMPRPRWWEIEDADVDVNAFDPAAEDLPRLLLAEFALVFGNDWFSVPVSVPVGSLTEVDDVEVTDTFGVPTDVGPVTGGAGDWQWFTHSGSGGDAPGVLLPPTLVGSLESDPVEEVALRRDEMANLAWGVERLVEGADGRPLDRTEVTRLPDADDPGEPQTPPQTDGLPRYTLSGDVPPYWYPLVPERVSPHSAEIRLRRGRLLGADESAVPGPLGRILSPGEPLALREEEVPRAGARVRRRYQLARWTDGSTHLWSTHERTTGTSEESSGLEFDTVRDAEEAPGSDNTGEDGSP